MERGYVKLWRKILDNPIFKDPHVLQLFIWCVARANWKEVPVTVRTGRGNMVVTLQRGQFLFGRHTAAEALGCPPSSIRNRMEVLKKDRVLDIEVDTQYSVVTILNYEQYQGGEETSGQGTGQGSGHPLDTDKKLKKNTSPHGVADADAHKPKPKVYYDEHGRPYQVLPSRPEPVPEYAKDVDR